MTQLSRRGFLAAAGTVSVGALSACGSNSSGSSSDAVELTVMAWADAGQAERYEQEFATFTEKNPDIAVSLEWMDVGSYQDKLNTLFAAGDPPDVMFMVGRWLGEYATRGVLADLSASDQLDFSTMNSGLLLQGQYQGAQYAVPTGSTAIAMIYNTRIVADAGLELPDDRTWTWADYAEFNAQIYDATGVHGAGFYVPWLPTITQYTRQHGQDLFTTDGTLGVSGETITEYFQMITDMRTTGAFAPPGSLEDNGTSVEQSPLGRDFIASQIIPSNTFGDYNSVMGGDLVLRRLPGETEGPRPGYTVTPTLLWCQAEASEHPAEAARLIDFLTNDPDSFAARSTLLGVPINADVAEEVSTGLDEDAQEFVDFTVALQEEELAPYEMEPAGAGEVQNILVSLSTEVEFERMTPQQAGEEFMSQAGAALEDAG